VILRGDISIIREKVVYIKKKRLLAIILLIAGMLIAVYPLAGQLYAKYQEDRMLEEWLNCIDAGVLEDLAVTDPETAYAQLGEAFGIDGGESSFSKADVAESNEGTYAQAGERLTVSYDTGGGAKGSSDLSEQRVLGIIQIPKIKVKEPIVEGVEKSNLRAGIGHIPGTPLPGQPGNCALAGHRNFAFKKLFRRLDELENGDEVVILTKAEMLRYTVTGKVVVEPDDVSVLQGSDDRSMISMITCTPMYIHSHRLVVFGELVERVPREP